MANHNAIGAVTATLRQLLQSAVSTDVAGAGASFVMPDGPASGVANPGVNIFLYQVTPNAAWRNQDLPTRDASSRLLARPRAALDLHYLLTCYGRDEDFEPQRVLGSVVRALHAMPVLTRPQITDALTAFPVLLPCDLASDVELVKFSEMPLTLEELSKLWSVFFQTTYHLSVAYRGTVVLVETEQSFSAPLPVLRRNLYVEILREPVIDQVVAASNDSDPILAGADIRLRGSGFAGDAVDIRIDGASAANVDVLSDVEATATIPPLQAGVHGAQIVHQRVMGTPPVAHPAAVSSNVCAFVLAPKIHKNGAYDITVLNPSSRTVAGVLYHSADLQIEMDPVVGKDQRVAFLLNEMVAADARSYTFQAASRSADTSTITIRAVDVLPGQYLVRVQVAGADSPLDVTGNSYSDPTVTL